MPVLSGHDYADYHTRRANNYVEKLCYDAYVDINGDTRVEFGQPPAALADGIIKTQALDAIITGGGNQVTTFDPEKSMSKWGRNLTVILSGAGTPTVTIRGRDWLGQGMSENIVGAGAASVVGKKAFFSLDSITTSAAVAGVTISVGWGNVLGLPYAMTKLYHEFVDDIIPAAGTFVPCLAPGTVQSLTTGDPRGTYTPAGAVVPNGVRNIVITGAALSGQLHGVPHFYS
jgi:hypothetical protein